MTQPLSPAAQSAIDAVASSMEGGFISPEFIAYEARKVAAALRAAADRTEADSIWHGYQEHTGVRWAAHQLRGIAAELEGGHG